MAVKKTGLGKGLNALIETYEENEKGKSVIEVSINHIEPGEGQPRQIFDAEKIESLAESIKEHGIIQPLIVTKEGSTYKIIAGERRWRAARIAGLEKVPVIERDATSKEIMELALIENIQREDLNPIEEAEAFERLINECSMTQDELAVLVGKSRPAITNTLRLLQFNNEIRNYLISGALSAGHARPLLSLDTQEEQIRFAADIIKKGYSVRQTEQLIKKYLKNKQIIEEAEVEENQEEVANQYDLQYMQDKLRSALGTKVKLDDKQGKGKIVIEYYSKDERERLLEYFLKEKYKN